MENTDYIKEVIRKNLRDKFRNYVPKSNSMPFHIKLLGKDRMALYSFIQSLNTTFGASLFEPVAVSLATANKRFKMAEKQHSVGGSISEMAQREIQEIMNYLSTGGDPDKKKEIERIRKVCNTGKINEIDTVKVDLYLESIDNEIFLFDLKTVKPNKSNFKDFKRTLLEWAALKLFNNPKAQINSLIAIPYNPFEPEPYQFWTSKGMLDKKEELKVAEEFWDFLGGNGAYEVLLDCFEQVGIELKSEIDQYFAKFK
jgi:type II restriction enzyme